MKLIISFLSALGRRLAWNQQNSPLAVGIAANVDAIGAADEWLMAAPYGETDYWIEDGKGGWDKFVQSFQKPQAERMVTAFNSLRGTKGDKFPGLPIYKGHPDADPKRWPDETRFGGIVDIKAGDEGLMVKPAWNSKGEENRRERFYVYPSPAWEYSQAEAARTKRIVPDVLRSIGLTNTPRIQGVPPWTNTDSHPNQKNQDTMNLKALALKLGLPETATFEEVETKVAANVAALTTAQNDKATAVNTVTVITGERDTAKTALTGAQDDADKFRKLAINMQLDGAIADRRLTAAERPAWETKFATNFDEAATELKAKTAALPDKAITLAVNGSSYDLATPNGRRLAFNARVDELMATGLKYDQAITKMRSTPSDAALIKAMDTPPEKAAA